MSWRRTLVRGRGTRCRAVRLLWTSSDRKYSMRSRTIELWGLPGGEGSQVSAVHVAAQGKPCCDAWYPTAQTAGAVFPLATGKACGVAWTNNGMTLPPAAETSWFTTL